MRAYRLSAAYLARHRRAALWRSALVLLLALAIPTWVGLQSEWRARTFALALPVLGATLGIALVVTLTAQGRVLASYRLFLEDDLLVRQIHGYPNIQLERSEIEEVVETPAGL